MHRYHNPPGIAGPHGNYSFGVESAPGVRWLHVAGQVGTRADGSVPERVEDQVEWTFRNIFRVLEAAGMEVADMVGMNSYLTSPEYVPAYTEVKLRMIGEARPTSTLLVVSGLARPEWKVEITAWAARA